jgi:hypothetical protein
MRILIDFSSFSPLIECPQPQYPASRTTLPQGSLRLPPACGIAFRPPLIHPQTRASTPFRPFFLILEDKPTYLLHKAHILIGRPRKQGIDYLRESSPSQVRRIHFYSRFGVHYSNIFRLAYILSLRYVSYCFSNPLPPHPPAHPHTPFTSSTLRPGSIPVCYC